MHRRPPPTALIVVAGAVACAVGLGGAARAQERLYIANDDHTDWYWTLDEAGYTQAYQDMLGFYLEQVEATAGNAANARGRFNLDGSLWAYTWEQHQPAAQMDRLMAHVAAGDISLQLHSLVLLGGAMPTEAVLRDMMYAGRLERRYGVTIDMAVMMENQTLAGGLASLWAGAGAKYSWRGICGCATQIPSASSRAREIYRFQGHDGQGVLMKWNSLVSDNRGIGGYAEAADPVGAVDVMEHDAGYRARWPYPVKAAFGFGWDAPQTTTDAFIAAAQTLSDPNNTVIVSNERDFFEDFSASVDVANQVPLFVGSHGNEWDLNTASLAVPSAMMRTSIEKLRTAEALSVIVGHADPAFLDGRFDGTDPDRERAQLEMGMYYDHDWTADSPTLHDARAQFQRDTAAHVKAYVDTLGADALARLGALVPAVPGETRYVVANGLATFVGAAVELPGLAETLAPGAGFSATDLGAGFDLPTQIVVDADGTRHAIVSLFVPAVGFTVVRVGPPPTAPSVPDVCTVVDEPDGSKTLNDTHVIVRVAPTGEITSLVNLHDNNEVAGGGLFTFQDNTAAGTVVLESKGPVRCSVRVDVPSVPPHSVRYTIEGWDRVDVEETITGNFGDTQGYTLDLTSLPGVEVRHEETGMVAVAKRISHGGDYADEDARTDFLTLNHFVDAGNAVFGFTVSSSEAAFMRVGTSTVDTLDEHPTSLFLVAGMQPDPALGFANQGGDARFVNHFSVLPRDTGYDGLLVMTGALTAQNAPVAVLASGGPGAPLAVNRQVLVNVVGVSPWWVKPAEDGASSGVIVRVWNTNTIPTEVAIRAPITTATRTTHIETDADGLPAPVVSAGFLDDTLEPDQLVTYRLFLGAEGEGEGEGEGGAAGGEGEGEGAVSGSEGEGEGDDAPRGCGCAQSSTSTHTRTATPLAGFAALALATRVLARPRRRKAR